MRSRGWHRWARGPLAAAAHLSPGLTGQHVEHELLQLVIQIWAKSAVVNNLWLEMPWG